MATENKPASNHPWRKWDDRAARLKSARKIANEKKHHEWLAGDELNKIRMRERARRKKYGIPIDLPKMNPWDFKKGRVS